MVLLELYLIRDQRLFLWLSLLAFFLAIASKELGHIAMPIAIALIWDRRRKLGLEMAYFALLGIFMFVFRKIVVSRAGLGCAALHPARSEARPAAMDGPALFSQLCAEKYWAPASAFSVLLICQAGFRYRWRWWIAAGLSAAAAGLITQLLVPDGGWGVLLIGVGPSDVISDLVYILACVMFWKYRKEKPGLSAALLFFVSFIPILQLFRLTLLLLARRVPGAGRCGLLRLPGPFRSRAPGPLPAEKPCFGS